MRLQKPYAQAADEVKAMLTEYCIKLKNTARFAKDAEGNMKTIYQSWQKTSATRKVNSLYKKSVDCEKCGNTGYRGRVGLHELLESTYSVRRNIQEHARVEEIFATGLEEGMRTLKQNGIEKVLQGITDMKQVSAVCIK